MLIGKTVRLRPIERRDLPLAVRWFSDPATRAMVARSAPPSMASQERWFEMLQKSANEVVFVIEQLPDPSDLDDDGLPIGVCGLHEIDWRHRGCVVGIVVGTEARGHGFGTEAMWLLARHAQRDLGLHRVQLEVRVDNARGQASYKKLGFVAEGIRRAALFKDGAFVDVTLMSVLTGELVDPASARDPRLPKKRSSSS